MAYSVALRIGLLSSCYYHGGRAPIVYPRDVSGNDGWLNNEDIIQMIDYVNNSSGLKFSEIREIIEFKEVESGATTVYFDAIAGGYNPSWTWSYGWWLGYGNTACSKGDYAWQIMKNATIEARVFFGSPVNMWSEPARITFGDPSKRAKLSNINIYWAQYLSFGRHLHIEFTAENLEPTPSYPFYYAAMYKEGYAGTSSIAKVTDENPTGIIRIKESEVADYIPDLYLTWNWHRTDVVHLTIPPFVCDEGAEDCQGFDLYECVNNQWQLKEENSTKCGYVPPPPNFEFVEDGCYIQYGDDLFCFADETKDIPPRTDIWVYFKVKNTGETASRLTVKVFDGDTKMCEKSPSKVIQPGEGIAFYTLCFKMTEVSRDLVMKVYEYGKTEEHDNFGCR